MRSELVYGALEVIQNRYQLCRVAAQATRKMLRPTIRIQDTLNEVLMLLHTSRAALGDLPAISKTALRLRSALPGRSSPRTR